MARTTKTAPTPAKAATKASVAKAAAPKAAASKRSAPSASKAAPAVNAAARKASANGSGSAVRKAAPTVKAAAAKKSPVPAAKKTPVSKTAPAAKKPAVAAKAAKPAEPKKAKPSFSAKFLAEMEQALHVERATYTKQYDSLRAEAASLVDDFESGDVQFDEESGEGDTINIERERDLALSEGARHQISEIDHALTKFALGTYGICEVSGDKIPEERLEAIPWVRERVEYKTGGFTRR